MIKRIFQENRIFVASTVTVLYLLLFVFFYYINRYAAGVFFLFFIFLIILSFLFIAISLVLECFKVVYNIRRLTFKYCIPAIIYAIPILYTFVWPYRTFYVPSERNVALRACFEGTQNQATLKFYPDSTFVLHWTGVFWYSKYFSGTYKVVSDTFFLSYKTEKPFRFGSKILNREQHLITLDTPEKKDQYFVPFYLGYCQGLN